MAILCYEKNGALKIMFVPLSIQSHQYPVIHLFQVNYTPFPGVNRILYVQSGMGRGSRDDERRTDAATRGVGSVDAAYALSGD
ncbi:MAG TPA: hypothetical protein VE912_16090 [Bacteroidales bacterium]|nr:hypothetical protein [Bacteroidales bacterium]